jgi:hypothetical protein
MAQDRDLWESSCEYGIEPSGFHEMLVNS